MSKERTSEKNVVARDKDGNDVYINLFDFIKDEFKILDKDGDQINGSTKLYPDFDFNQVAIQKKMQLNEFIKIHTARDDDALLA